MKHKEIGPFHTFEYEDLSEFEADMNSDFYWDETEVIMKNVRETLRDEKKRMFMIGVLPFTVVRYGSRLYVYMVEDDTVAQMIIEGGEI